MKKLIAVVFTVSLMIGSLSAKAENAPATDAAAAGAQHTQAAAANPTPKFQPIGKTFADTVNQFKPSVPPCIPQQGTQSFSSGY